MKSRRPLIAAAVFLAGGLLRLPLEQAVTADFRQQGLLSPPLEIATREKIGQNSWAIALSGLRTLVATFAQLQATGHFNKCEWTDLEGWMNTAVELSPQGTYYWDMGAWHMAYNAAAWYRLESDLPPLRKQAEERRWVEKGRQFYIRGIANNPGDWQLPMLYAVLLTDGRRFPDDQAAVEALRKAVATGKAPPYVHRQRFFAEARAGKDPAEMLAAVRSLLVHQENRVPTLLALCYTLEYQTNEPEDPAALALSIFGSEERALRILGDYYVNNVVDRMPERGVETGIRILEGRRGISPEDPKSYIRLKEVARQRLTLGH
ncbi:hypothetical protein OKA04_22355 [Luteolibacter flavescens]|uniref:DUF4034 domain-containing protein n=1 Tax=Luteolibacter flavescens TaxID=1859460 RepID=A0ABT3FV92_9BACT|nr:hypothetical protein [Luteolibacter flavescens]MCW1887495.1 hypothetical protein [Luteolibacter flavescens]